MLQLTDSEKFKVGVGRRPAAASSPVVDDLGNSSFTELWVNFLLNSANGDPDPAGNISRRNSIESLKSLTSANSWFQNVSEPPVQGNNSSN